MTVQAALKAWSNQTLSQTASDDGTVTITINENYQVICDATDDSIEILRASGLPALYQPYPSNPLITVTDRKPKRIGPTFYHVAITWKGEVGPDGEDDSPINRPPEITWSNVESTEPIDEDIDGDPIVTANDEPIHGVTTKINDLRATIKRNFLTVNLAAVHAYLRSVNSDTIVTDYGNFAPGLGRMTQFRTTNKQHERAGRYVEVNAVVDFRYPYRTTAENAWHARVLHQGFKVFDLATLKNKRAIDPATRRESNTPVLLSLTGAPLGTDPPNWLEFARYTPLPYSNLGLF